ncbi:MAG: pyridoxal phosphate-dependent aminotransferase [Promethearchaeota archaeon]
MENRMRLAERLSRLGTETAFEVLDRIARFPPERRANVVSFAIGEPDFNTPEHVKQAGIRAIQENYTHYGPSGGLWELREAIAEYAGRARGVDFGPENVTVLPSAKLVIAFAVLTCTNPGDEVIYPNPGYPIYESQVRVFGCRPVSAALTEENGWNYDTDHLRRLLTDKTKMIVLNSPHNPTGGVLTRENLEAIAEMAVEHDLWVLSDEIYSNFVYDGQKFLSISSLPGMAERTVVLDGFSKFFAMTGWRLGYALTNPEVAERFATWATNTVSCTATFTQMAGLAALREDDSPSWAMVREFERRRDLIHQLLNEVEGVTALKPAGAFYIFANVTEACRNLGLRDAVAFQDYLLDEVDVAVLARTYFGARDPDETQEYVRLSYCVSREDVERGMARVKQAVEK